MPRIDTGCMYYVGDEDCHKCIKKGLLFNCEGCNELNEQKEIEEKKWSNKLVVTGFSSHDCETHYKCPFCGEHFRSWSIPIRKVFKCKCGRGVWTD